MKSKYLIPIILLTSLVAAIPHAEAAWTLHRGRFVDVCELATMTAPEHFDAGTRAYMAGDWPEAMQQFNITAFNFPSSPYGQEANYFLGVSYYNLEEYDFANNAFSEYLKVQSNPRYFQSAVEYKFCIAEQLNAGARCRLFGTKQLPKWWEGKSLALKIYDEIVAAVPCHELAAKSLVSKGSLLWNLGDYRGSVDAFQMAIRRFPKWEMAPDCYLYISRVYIEQSRYEFQNSDILAFAELNLRKFQRDFPREERLSEAEENVKTIKEIYAGGLYETGRFYERKFKPKAAIIYYNDVIRRFPATDVAGSCRERILALDPSYSEPKPDSSDAEVTEEEIDLDHFDIDIDPDSL